MKRLTNQCIMLQMSNELEIVKKESSREQDLERVQRIVSDNIPHLTAAALASALGGTVLLKVSVNEQGKIKYVPVSESEQIIQGLEWISEYGNKFDQEGGYFILQQRPPDAKFWDMLASRHLGKIPDEKVDLTKKLNLAEIARKAIPISQKTKEIDLINEPIPSSWASNTSPDEQNDSNSPILATT